MPSEFAPPGGRPKVTKKQIQQMQENYKKAGELLKDTSEEEAQEKAILDELFEEEFDTAFDVSQKVGVYVGRFQPFHKGHENVLKQMFEENDKVLVFIGTGGEERNNPFSYEQCRSFLDPYMKLGESILKEIADQDTNEEWVRLLITEIAQHTVENSIWNFYGGDLHDDYAISSVKAYASDEIDSMINYIEIPRDIFLIEIQHEPIALSATLCRQALYESNWEFLEDALPSHVYHILQGINNF